MGEIFRFKKRKGIRCNYCGEEKQLEEDRWYFGDFKVMFDRDDKLTGRAWYYGRQNSYKEVLWHTDERDGWRLVKIGERKLLTKYYTWRYIKLWFCPDCSFRMPRVEEGEDLKRLFFSKKVLQFKNPSQAHEVGSGEDIISY